MVYFWEHSGGSWNGRCCYILRSFGVLYGHFA
jgi:hypothetical protein